MRERHPDAHLATYTGLMQADAYAGFNRLFETGRKPGPIMRHGREDHRVQDQEPSKLTRLLRVSPGFVAPVIFGLAILAVFVYIPFVSDYAFWFVVMAYIIMAFGYRPPSK
jgi:hypothetical protein